MTAFQGFAAASAAVFALGFAAAMWRPAWVAGAPRAVLLAVLALTGLAGATLVRTEPLRLALAIDPSTEPLLPRGDPGQRAYSQAIRDFGSDEVYVIALETSDVFRSETLRRMRRIGESIARLDGVTRVESLVDVTSFRYDAAEEWIEVRPFIEDIPEEAEALATLRERALTDPLYRKTLVSTDARGAAINVFFREMTDAEFIASDLDGAIGRILAAETDSDHHFAVAGRPHLKSRVYHQMVRDLRILIPLAIGVMALLLALLFRSVRGVVLPLAMVLTATLWTFAAMAWLERALTVLTTLLAPTLIATGSVYGVHVVAAYDELAAGARRPFEAALATLGAMRLPVMVAGVTTAVGFGALCISDVPAVVELGAFAMFGIVSVTLLSLTALPAALALLPLRARDVDAGSLPERALAATLAWLGRVAVARSGFLIVLWAALCVGAGASLPRIVIDTDYLSFFPAQSSVRRDFDTVNRLLSGAVPLYVTLDGGAAGTFREPEALRSVELLQERIDGLAGVSRTHSLVDTLRILNRAIEADDPAEERIPDSRSGVTELLYMIPKQEVQRFANVNHSRSNLVVRTGEVGSAAVRDLAGRIESVVAGDARPAGIDVQVTGNAVLLSRSADAIARSQPRSVGLAAAAIFLLVAGALGSVRLAGIAMVPNVVPVLLFFGSLGLGAATLSLPTSLIGSVALGIAIDATVHYLARYRQGRTAGRSPEDAAVFATEGAGRPISIGALMLSFGFGVMIFSSFATLQQFGILCAATMAVRFATDLLLLPALLVRLRG